MSFVWGVVVGLLTGGPLVLLVLAFFAGAALEPAPLIVRVATFRDDSGRPLTASYEHRYWVRRG